MKTKGRRQSKNVSDVRGPTGAYARPSGLTRAKAGSDIQKWDQNPPASKSKMAKDAGITGIDKFSKKKLPTKSGNPYGGKSPRTR